ncbi:gamma-glutamyl-gamma-aminobutyrate hydrolase family protein [Millisia brevis]|uniref:gamma-glutamyl-gamma-aminobutyrate hydrolase family protein n=1 Tax=Millisia brevis TaxID=264148 RepID=UPI000B0C0F18|nr:gamma-glutamyl-gamma-aminobutyrate hydrolase family protein [Millisia brevis]
MSVTPVVTRAEVEDPGALDRSPGRPHVAVLGSLNYPDLTESTAELVRRFTRTALEGLTAAGASYTLVDSSVPEELAAAAVDADALFVLGGGDIAAACYGGPSGEVPNSYGVDEAVDRASIALITDYADGGYPVLGICRGSQLINVTYGGSIIPDITDYALHHGGPDEPLFLDEKITVVAGTRLAGIVGPGTLVVRSGHHQAVDRVGDGLVVAARALDGVVEGVEDPNRWVLGVQFHPEDDDGGERELRLLLGALIEAAGQPRVSG